MAANEYVGIKLGLSSTTTPKPKNSELFSWVKKKKKTRHEIEEERTERYEAQKSRIRLRELIRKSEEERREALEASQCRPKVGIRRLMPWEANPVTPVEVSDPLASIWDRIRERLKLEQEAAQRRQEDEGQKSGGEAGLNTGSPLSEGNTANESVSPEWKGLKSKAKDAKRMLKLKMAQAEQELTRQLEAEKAEHELTPAEIAAKISHPWVTAGYKRRMQVWECAAVGDVVALRIAVAQGGNVNTKF